MFMAKLCARFGHVRSMLLYLEFWVHIEGNVALHILRSVYIHPDQSGGLFSAKGHFDFYNIICRPYTIIKLKISLL